MTTAFKTTLETLQPKTVVETARAFGYNERSEVLADFISKQTQTADLHYARVVIAHHWCTMASAYRQSVETPERSVVPINTYAVALLPSGAGKGKTISTLRDRVFSGFFNYYLKNTKPAQEKKNLEAIKLNIEMTASVGSDEAHKIVTSVLKHLGEVPLTYGEGTAAKLHQQILRANISGTGGPNILMDEIGFNLAENAALVAKVFPLYDDGKLEAKTIKGDHESIPLIQNSLLGAQCPTNVLLFGTPSAVLDAGLTEKLMMDFITAGLGRRSLFCYRPPSAVSITKTAIEVYEDLQESHEDAELQELIKYITNRATEMIPNSVIKLPRESALILIDYKIHCQNTANSMLNAESAIISELSNRFFKVLKNAASLAVLDGTEEVTPLHIYQTINLVEDSGEHFQRLLDRPSDAAIIAEYILDAGSVISYSQLNSKVKAYKGTPQAKQDLMQEAISYANDNSGVITTHKHNSILSYSGYRLDTVSTDSIHLSSSEHPAYDFVSPESGYTLPDLETVIQQNTCAETAFCVHGFMGGHRTQANAIPGFELVVLDIDGGTPLNTAKILLRNYTHLIYTTKSHTEAENRYRIILPLSHRLRLDTADYRDFMNNVLDWLPLGLHVDEAASRDSSKKWLLNATGSVQTCLNMPVNSEGKDSLLPATWFIPNSTESTTIQNTAKQWTSMDGDAIALWFSQQMAVEGDRNNLLFRYMRVLIEMYDTPDPTPEQYDTVRDRVVALNKSIAKPLDDQELFSTVLNPKRMAGV